MGWGVTVSAMCSITPAARSSTRMPRSRAASTTGCSVPSTTYSPSIATSGPAARASPTTLAPSSTKARSSWRALRRPTRRRSRLTLGWCLPRGEPNVLGRLLGSAALGRRGRRAGDLHEGGEGGRLAHGEIGEDLAVDLHAGVLQTVDEPAVAEAVLAGGGVDAGDPQLAEVAL